MLLLLRLSRFSRVRLWDPIDGSPPGSSVAGILQAKTLEWVAISFSNACMHAKSLQSCPTVQPHRWQPTRLLCPQDSLGKKAGVGCHFLLHFLLQPSLVSRCDPLAGPWAQLQALSSASAVGAGLELPPTLSPQPLAPLRWSWTLPPGPLCLERPLSSHLKQHSSELVLVPSSHWPPCKGRDVGLTHVLAPGT